MSAGRSLKQGIYVIQAKIDQGGMSAIYRVLNRQQNRISAVKEMNEQVIPADERDQVIAAFEQEAKILMQLNHPNLLKVFEFFEEQGRYYMIMELIQGRSLLAILQKEGPRGLPESKVLIWAEQLCNVLDYLHSRQPKIIYRDLKPGNVMAIAGTDQIKLIDFGIARHYKPGKTKDTITFGTDGYAPPEQYGKEQTDEQSDIYALGATLHQLLTGHDPSSTLFQFPLAHNLNRNVSKETSEVIAKAVAVRRQDRYASIAEMKAALWGGDADNSRSPPKTSKTPAVPKPTPKSSSKSNASPQPAGNRLNLSQTHFNFGTVCKGQQPAPQRKVLASGSGLAVSTDQTWLEAKPFKLNKNQTEVQVTVRSELMSLGRREWPVKPRGDELPNRIIEIVQRIAMVHARFIVPVSQTYQGKISIDGQGGGHQEVDVAVTLTPKIWHTILGWGGVIGAMLLEIFIILLIISAVLQGCT